MATIAQKIEQFKASLKAGQYEVDEGFEAFIMGCAKEAGLLDVAAPAQAPVADAPKQVLKKLNCYNIFMKEKMAEFKAQNIPVGDRMGKVSEAWKALTQEEKLAWKAKADLLEPVTIVSKGMPAKKGPKSMTGYQFYVKETMPTVKVNEKIAAKDRLAEIGKMWKSLSEEQHAAYKVKAGTVIKTQ